MIGLGSALAVTRLLESQLFGLSASDPVTLAAAMALLASVAALAGFIPARRAASVDPMLALRSE